MDHHTHNSPNPNLHLSADLYFHHENPNFPNSSCNNSNFPSSHHLDAADDHGTFMVVQEASINSNSTSSSSNPAPGGSTFFFDPFDPFFPWHNHGSSNINNNHHHHEYFPSTLFAPHDPNPLPAPLVNGFNNPQSTSPTYFQPLMDLQMIKIGAATTTADHVVNDSSSCCLNNILLEHQKIMNSNSNNNDNNRNDEVFLGGKISSNHKGRDHQPAKRKRIVDKESEIIKGPWTSDEDRLLVESVENHGVKKWSTIAKLLPGRIGKQCRERWHNHLKPNIKKDRWSEEEDRILIELHRKEGNRWAEIAKNLPGRSENTIKNHWNATKRRQLSSRARNNTTATSSSKSSSSTTTTTPLQEYIKSLILHPNSEISAHKNGAGKNNNNSSSSSGYLDKYYSSSGCTSPADNIAAIPNVKPENDDNAFVNAVDDEEEERFQTIMAQSDLMDSQMNMNMNVSLELQKEMDFMEMLSFGYI